MPRYAMKSQGESINHFAAVRFRIVGSGEMNLRLNSLNDIENQDLISFSISEETNREPTRLCNFKQQRARLHGYMDESLNNYFKITRIVFFVKAVETSYPG